MESLDETPLSASALGAMMGVEGVEGVRVVEGTDRRWPQSHSVVLSLSLSGGGEMRVFAKRVVCPRESRKPHSSVVRDLLSNRTEARFYLEFAPILRSRGLKLFNVLGLEQHFPSLDERKEADISSLRCAQEEEQAHVEAPIGGGLLLLLESAEGYVQASPLSLDQAYCTLASLARFHAASWEDGPLLERARQRLHHTGGWWCLLSRMSPT